MLTPSGRSWVDWKKAMTFFTLVNSPIPSETILGELRVMLSDLGANQYINCQSFVKVSIYEFLILNSKQSYHKTLISHIL